MVSKIEIVGDDIGITSDGVEFKSMDVLTQELHEVDILIRRYEGRVRTAETKLGAEQAVLNDALETKQRILERMAQMTADAVRRSTIESA